MNHVYTLDAPTYALTTRQLQILALAQRGLTNKAIARTLDLRAKTVKNHMTHIFDALGVRTRSECIVWCMRRGLLR